jgi:hypothetical protein
MSNVSRLAATLSLMSVLTLTAFAGEIPSPPCAPGETQGPPCSSQSVTDGSTDPSETNGPPSNAIDVTMIVEAVQLTLSLF